ncbi:MAG: aminotransferase class I/II-fold pyridoxal phosphate-dependent enzyme, partial [Phycisphaerae bacterium]|nr:aminotransferase class I/II-fold pyridoxal phosphate-dependent enzyme [Phycisphaerae bacterium]
ELAGIAEVARQHDCIVVSDEVYEHIWFDRRPVSISTLPGMRERTIVLGSLGKTFSLTGWKIGWAIAPPALTQAVRAAHQFLTFCSAAPLQRAAVDALHAPESYYEQLRADYAARRNAMLAALRGAGFEPYVPEGSYFILADHTRFGFDDDVAFATHLVERVGVAAVPCSAFYADKQGARALTRFAFCKTLDTIAQAGERMKALRSTLPPICRPSRT